MTRSNRKVCNEWSKQGKIVKDAECFACKKPIIQKGNGLYVCCSCGLEQDLHKKGE